MLENFLCKCLGVKHEQAIAVLDAAYESVTMDTDSANCPKYCNP